MKHTIKPGLSPIFIVAADHDDASAMAVLLSRRVIVPARLRKLGGVLNKDNNYFFNNDTIRVTKGISHKLPLKKEDEAKIRLMMDEGRDSGKLWGLQCSYDQFFAWGVSSFFSQASVIFIFRDNGAEEQWYQKALEYIQAYEENTYLFSNGDAKYLQDIVLAALPLEQGYQHADWQETPVAMATDKTSKRLPANLRTALTDTYHLRREGRWFSGGEWQVILVAGEGEEKEAVGQDIERFLRAFPIAPQIQVLVTGRGAGKMFGSWVLDHYYDYDIKVSTIGDSLAGSLNSLIANSPADYILFDDQRLSYKLSELLQAFASEAKPILAFGSLSATQSFGEKVALADILTTFPFRENIAFSKQTFQEIEGFDASLADDAILWDFAIRALGGAGEKAVVADAAVNQGTKAEGQPLATGDHHSEGYKQVIQKHRRVFQQSLEDVIQLVALRQHLPQFEIKDLRHKISTLQSLLNYRKDELNAVYEMNASLLHRINKLEHYWFYRLGKRLESIKRIFFKKKEGGAGVLKRFLKFLLFTFSKPGFNLVRKVMKGGFRRLYLWAEDRPVQILYLDDESSPANIFTYHDWIRAKLDKDRLQKIYEEEQEAQSYQPKLSIVMPVYNPPIKYLKQAIESVINQQYINWELCIADDCSPDPAVSKMLHAYSAKDARIKVQFRTENGHISASSNSALQLATGEYILFMDHDDLLTRNCLFEVVKYINHNRDTDILYSDEDKIDETGHHLMPHFKPDWAPHNLLSRNYFGHVVVMKKEIVDATGGFRLGFEGSQDYDLILRATEISNHIGHIPKVLYHWRIHQQSAAQSEEVKPYAYIAAHKALSEALVRRDTPGTVHYLSGLRGYRIEYDIVKPGKVSIVIPTKDQVKLLKITIDSILELTGYPEYEILILNNNSNSREFFSFIDDYTTRYADKIRCINASFPFNFSKLMNLGVQETDGRYVLLMNNDMKVIDGDWLSKMVSHAQQDNTAAVGVKLLYPDDTIQHAGVIVGLGGVAGHAFVHFHKDEAGYFNYIQSLNNFSALTAACLMFRREVYEQVGGMNEELEVEYNDVDLCLRFLEAGYYNVYLPDVELYHFESSTRGHPHQNKESYARHIREIEIFKKQWQQYIDHDPNYNPNLNPGVHDFSLNFSA